MLLFHETAIYAFGSGNIACSAAVLQVNCTKLCTKTNLHVLTVNTAVFNKTTLCNAAIFNTAVFIDITVYPRIHAATA